LPLAVIQLDITFPLTVRERENGLAVVNKVPVQRIRKVGQKCSLSLGERAGVRGRRATLPDRLRKDSSNHRHSL
jgi:hypothetical protein